ncbi:IS30 family transposase [Gallaecimonas pentaromativorans]|uniref:IS30 family transposase n=1 Tax=Gallaecimonas pentaromativorans TaxID=584787 RepID=A0A3N1PMP3_9GAMM|nr:IS30 family transposase [Gallaecimonas pentaromativorans]
MSYQQLTEGKRYQIAALIAQGCSRADVAKAIGVHRTTLYRELKRNSLDGVYRPQQAHAATSTRRAQARKYRVPTQTLEYVELTLSWQWSPEQISQLSHRISRPVSHEWIYRHVAADKARGGKLYKALRQGHKRYRKGRHPKRAVIAERRSIEERPAIVDSRERFGDWEVDTVLGKQGSGALGTLAERKSRFYLVRKVKTKEASEVSEAIIDMLKPYQAHVHTITADNGSEFVEHKAIAKALAADFYLRPSLQSLGARPERELQRPAAPVHPEGHGSVHGQHRGCQDGTAAIKPAAAQMLGVQAASAGIPRIPTSSIGGCCTSELNSRPQRCSRPDPAAKKG